MDTAIRTSFIPKESLGKPAPERREGGLGFFTFLSITILVVSLFGWVAAYSYKALLTKEVAAREADLDKAKQAFEPGLLKVFENLDRRLHTANALLEDHTTIAPLFALLDELTLKSVRFTAFTYASNNQTGVVKISGEALKFPSVALLALALSKDSRIENPIFSNLGVEDNGHVTFDVSFNVDPSLVLYSPHENNLLEGL